MVTAKFVARVYALNRVHLGSDVVQRGGRAQGEFVESVVGVHENGEANATNLQDSGHIVEQLMLRDPD